MLDALMSDHQKTTAADKIKHLKVSRCSIKRSQHISAAPVARICFLIVVLIITQLIAGGIKSAAAPSAATNGTPSGCREQPWLHSGQAAYWALPVRRNSMDLAICQPVLFPHIYIFDE